MDVLHSCVQLGKGQYSQLWLYFCSWKGMNDVDEMCNLHAGDHSWHKWETTLATFTEPLCSVWLPIWECQLQIEEFQPGTYVLAFPLSLLPFADLKHKYTLTSDR